MSLLKQDIIRKKQIEESNVTKLDIGKHNSKYKVEAIHDSAIYIRK